MADFMQHGTITTVHDLGTVQRDRLEAMLRVVTRRYRIGLILPVTAADLRAEPFARIVGELEGADYIEQIVVALGSAPAPDDLQQALLAVARLGEKAQVLWTDGPRLQQLYQLLGEAGLNLSSPGKGRSVWTAFGFMLANPRLQAFALHDCDIVNYQREMLARLCLPIVHPGLDFEFCKAYYARCTDRMYGRVVRLLVVPLLRTMIATFGPHPFLTYLESFRYPLSGEFAITTTLARSNRVPSDWGLEVGTLAEVFRNTSLKRVCQVDICRAYEHKHQELSAADPGKGLMRMALDILTSVFRTVAGMGLAFQPGHFSTLRCAYLRSAQDAIRQYHADALINGLLLDRHEEEQAVESFAQRITEAGEKFLQDPSGGPATPNWTRVYAALPEFPQKLVEAVAADRAECAGGTHQE